MEVNVESTFPCLTWGIAFVSTLITFTVWWKRRKQPKRKREIPYISTVPFFTKLITALIFRTTEQLKQLNLSDYLFELLTGISHLYYKEKAVQGFWAGQNYIFCYDATIAEKIFQSSAAINKDWIYKLLEPWLGTGLLTSGQKKWRIRRKMLTPAFHFRILKDFLISFNHHSKVMVENFKKLEGEVVDITNIVPLCTLDIIAETTMGVSLNAQSEESAEYVEAVKFVTSSCIELFTMPWNWITPIYYLSPLGRERRRCLKIIHNFGRTVIRKRKQKILEHGEINKVYDDFQDFRDDVTTKKRRALLDLLLYHHMTDGSLGEEDIREEVDTFMFGGHDTTSMAINWGLYLLGLHKDIQEKAYEELFRIYGDDKERTVTMEELKEMKYLENIVKETLRLYPSVPFIVRRTSREIETDDYVIPTNSSVAVYIYGIHRDPAIFPNPEVFDPDRFLPENCVGRHPYAYVPFSAGFRNCIGQRFGMMEVKTVLSYIIRNFTVCSLDHRDVVNVAGDIILRPSGQLRLIFHKR